MGVAYFHIFTESDSNSLTADNVVQLTCRPVLALNFRAAVKLFCEDKRYLEHETMHYTEEPIINQLRAYPTFEQAVRARDTRDRWRLKYFQLKEECHEIP